MSLISSRVPSEAAAWRGTGACKEAYAGVVRVVHVVSQKRFVVTAQLDTGNMVAWGVIEGTCTRAKQPR
jgi:hypothetical protein